MSSCPRTQCFFFGYAWSLVKFGSGFFFFFFNLFLSATSDNVLHQDSSFFFVWFLLIHIFILYLQRRKQGEESALDEIATSHIPSIPFSSIPVLPTFLRDCDSGGRWRNRRWIMQGLKNHFILFFKSNITVINDKKKIKQRMFWSPGGHSRLGSDKKKRRI